MDPQQKPDYDAVIVGAGFSGVYMLHVLRKIGLKCRIFEVGSGLGGIWWSSMYPGARVDSEVPVYEFSAPEVWKDWTWTEKYPSSRELQEYFDHVDKVWDIKKDVEFNVRVIGGQFDSEKNMWKVETDDGRVTTSQFFIPGTGVGAKPYTPDFKGIDSFKGIIHHSSSWPREGIDVKGKRVGVIGTGATGVQIIQEWARDAEQLFVFQRTPNLALPMRQAKLAPEVQETRKATYPQFFENRLTTFGGMRYSFRDILTMDASPAEREAVFQELWENGGFQFWLGGFTDLLRDDEANRQAYAFWAKKTRARIDDPKKKDILAPLELIHHFGTKRPSLEQNYYEIFNQSNVDLVDVRTNALEEITPDGILLKNGSFYPLDVIAVATGFDTVTGGLTQMNLRAVDGKPLADEWKDGITSYLGVCRNGYPNMFWMFGPQAPTSFANGPSCIEAQGQFVANVIQKMREDGLKYIEPKPEVEAAYTALIHELSEQTLLPQTKSWYMGYNIPGKKIEQLNWAGGLPPYIVACKDAIKDWEKFITA